MGTPGERGRGDVAVQDGQEGLGGCRHKDYFFDVVKFHEMEVAISNFNVRRTRSVWLCIFFYQKIIETIATYGIQFPQALK